MRTDPRRALAPLFVLILVLAAAGPVVVADDNGGGVPRDTSVGDFLPQVDVEAEDVSIQIDVGEDGTADWRIDYRVRLDDEGNVDAFGSVRENITSNPSSYTEKFRRRMVSTANASETATGRKMAIRNVSVSAERRATQNYGVVFYTFEWRGFAESSDTIETGGVLRGFFLDERTTLVLRWHEEYAPAEVEPEPDERRDSSVVWNGPMEFGRNGPRVVLSSPGSPLKALFGGVVVLLPLAGIALAVYRRRGREEDAAEEAGAEKEKEKEEAEGISDEEEEEKEEKEEDIELLSNEERVMRELEKNDGRMKQQTLVESLGWTEAKTSQVVNDMHDEGTTDKYRLGRENVLAMPYEDEDEDDADGEDGRGIGVG